MEKTLKKVKQISSLKIQEEVQDLFKLRLQMLEDESERANVEK